MTGVIVRAPFASSAQFITTPIRYRGMISGRWIRLANWVYRVTGCGDTSGMLIGWGDDACTILFALTRTPILNCVRGCGTSV